MSRILGIGKKLGFQRIIKREKAIKDYSKAFSLPKQSQGVVESNGCKAMVTMFNADQKDSLASIRYNMLCKKVARAKMYIWPERLPSPPRPVNFIPCRLTTRLWNGWDVVMKWSHLSGDGS